jgi:hypothetical protein
MMIAIIKRRNMSVRHLLELLTVSTGMQQRGYPFVDAE